MNKYFRVQSILLIVCLIVHGLLFSMINESEISLTYFLAAAGPERNTIIEHLAKNWIAEKTDPSNLVHNLYVAFGKDSREILSEIGKQIIVVSNLDEGHHIDVLIRFQNFFNSVSIAVDPKEKRFLCLPYPIQKRELVTVFASMRSPELFFNGRKAKMRARDVISLLYKYHGIEIAVKQNK